MMLELFAQAVKKGAAAPDPAAEAAAAGFGFAMIAAYAVMIIVLIVLQILFLMALSNCMKQCSPRNRKLEPGQVWLCLIPLFGSIWLILCILKISETLEKEFRSRGRPQEGDYGKTMGLIFVISGFICGCVTPIFWIIYWLKISNFTKLLIASKGKTRRPAEDDEDEDEAPRPKKRRPIDEDDDE